ncbi:MAG TPA: hypothetical protein VJP86_09830 [Vicinamibacterales bacterium]|nr:hypothetical protein [Vicinamibacterales bacterium]
MARYREVDPETQLKFIKLVIVEDIDTVKLSLARYTPTRITFSARVQRFIDANYLHQCRLDLVAAEFNVSVGTLTSRFKAECA